MNEALNPTISGLEPLLVLPCKFMEPVRLAALQALHAQGLAPEMRKTWACSDLFS